MRILHVSQVTESGGLVNVLLNVLEDQTAREWEVHLACPDDGGELFGAAAQIEGVTVHRWESVRSPARGVVREARALQRVVGRVDPEIVHMHSSKAGMIGRLVVRGRRPSVFQPHAWSYEAVTGLTRQAAVQWERFATRWTTGTLCVSDGEALTGVDHRTLASKHATVYNGVDMNVWAPRDRAEAREKLGLDPESAVVVSVGRLVEQKGQDVAVTAWPAIRRSVPAELYLIGEGADRPRLEAMNRRGVHFVGFADPRDWYAAADLVLVPSRWEGMPLVILEAMACGRNIVTTDVAGARECLGSHGRVIPIDDKPALAAAVVEALGDPAASEAEGRALRARAVELFDASASCAGFSAFDAACAGQLLVPEPRPPARQARDQPEQHHRHDQHEQRRQREQVVRE